MKFKILGLTFFIAIFSNLSFAQNTNSTEDVSYAFDNAIELFQNKKYSVAQDRFRSVRKTTRKSDDHKFINIQSEYYEALCAFYLGQKDAIFKLQNFLKNHKDHALSNYAYFYLGKSYFKKKKHNKSIEHLCQVSSKNLTNEEIVELNFMLGYTYFFKKDFPSCKENLLKIYSIPSAYYYQSNYYLGYIAYYQKDYVRALGHFSAIQESKAYQNIVPFYIAQIYFTQEDYRKVIEFTADISEDSDIKYYTEITNLIAQSHYHLRNFEKAIPLMEYYFENSKEILKSDVYNLGYAYYQKEDYVSAMEKFTSLADSEDSLGQNANYLLGDCFLKTDNKEGAKVAYQNASEMNFDKVIKETSSFNHAKLTYELSYNMEAIENIQNFLSEFPYSKYQREAKELLAEILLNTKNYQLAMDIIDAIDSPTPKVKLAYQKAAYYRAVELFNDDYIEASVDVFTKSLTQPYDKTITAKAHYWKGEALYSLEQFKEAADEYRFYTEAAPVADDLELIENKSFAYYSLAYSHYNQVELVDTKKVLTTKDIENLNQARIYFSSSLDYFNQFDDELKKSIAYRKTQPDAILRLADCNYLLNDKKTALKHYHSIYSAKLKGADYALYQSALIHSLYGFKDSDKRIALLKRLLKDYSFSIYADDAMYGIAQTYQNDFEAQNIAEKSDSAILYFKRLTDAFPGSQLGRTAISKLALIHFNKKEYDQAEKMCDILLSKYPNTAEVNAAINIMEDVYKYKGEIEDLDILFREKYGRTIRGSKQDSLSYSAAHLQYVNEHYQKAESLFNSYIEKFPTGFFLLDAHYYSGDCAYREKRHKTALEHFTYVTNEKHSVYTENSLLKVSYIYYKVDNDMKNAFKAYSELLNISETISNKLIALRGLSKTSFKLKKMDKLKLYSTTLLNMQDASMNDIVMSQLHLGKVLMSENQIDSAKTYFEQVKEKSSNLYGVDARYEIASIFFMKEQYDTSMTLCFDIIQNLPNYTDLLAKTFVMLGMNYHKLDNNFQAKATLQSIVDSYDGDKEIINDAKEKLAMIVAIETKLNEHIIDSVDIVKDSVLIEEEKEVIVEYETLIIGGDTLLIEKDNEVEIPTLNDSINADSSIIGLDTNHIITPVQDSIIKDSIPIEKFDSIQQDFIEMNEDEDPIMFEEEPSPILEEEEEILPTDSLQNKPAIIDSNKNNK